MTDLSGLNDAAENRTSANFQIDRNVNLAKNLLSINFSRASSLTICFYIIELGYFYDSSKYIAFNEFRIRPTIRHAIFF